MEDRKMKQEQDVHAVYSRELRAGRRIYYFDVKKTQRGELYLVLTESKMSKRTPEETGTIEKHRVMMFPEDLERMKAEFLTVVDYIQKENGQHETVEEEDAEENILQSGHSGEIKLDIDF
jgi:hypothetical protein